MLDVIIVDDLEPHLMMIKQYVQESIEEHGLDMRVAMTAQTPDEVMKYVPQRDGGRAAYFLDVDLNCEISGIELGEFIRRYDPDGYIVIITTYSETMPLTFEYRLAALDFISKDDLKGLKGRIEGCLLKISERHNRPPARTNFMIDNVNEMHWVDYSEINWFETSVEHHNRIEVRTTSGERYSFFGTIREVIFMLGIHNKHFLQCSRSHLINLHNVKSVNYLLSKIVFTDGSSCQLARSHAKELKKVYKKWTLDNPKI